MLQQTTWGAVRTLNLIGRDLVNHDPHFGSVRGPISEVRVNDDGWVVITQRWTAKEVISPGSAPRRWRFHQSPDQVVVVPEFAPPAIRHNGCIVFVIPACGTLSILPEGDRLDPAIVEGLPAQSPA